MRPANPPEERVLRAQRQAGIISADQFRTAMDLLEATETCDKCQGSGNSYGPDVAPGCEKCDSTGQMRVLR